MKHIMVVGYDVYHDTQQKGKSVGACLFSTDSLATKYFAQCALHGDHREQVENLIGFFKSKYQAYYWVILHNLRILNFLDGLKKYHERNGALPERIIFYRDGVAEGQLPAIYQHEMPALLESMRYFGREYK